MKIKHLVAFVTIIFLTACKKDKELVYKIEGKQLAIDSSLINNEKISDIIAPYKKQLNEQLDTSLSKTSTDLTRVDGKLESSLGNLMADICFEQGNPVFNKQTNKTIDFVLFNYGGIRAPIPKGTITARNAFEVMPFENELVIAELSGQKVKELLQYLAINKKAHPISKLRLKLNKDSFQEVTINNLPFDGSKNYYVLTSDYLQEGGDKMNFFKNPVSLHKTGYKIRTALIDYFKKTDSIIPNLDNRFTYAN